MSLDARFSLQQGTFSLAAALQVAAGETVALVGPTAQASRRPCGRWPGSTAPTMDTSASPARSSTTAAPRPSYRLISATSASCSKTTCSSHT